MSVLRVEIDKLRKLGVEVLPRGSGKVINLPAATRLETPCSLKWTQYEHSLDLGAFSYQVSGFCAAAKIGRYCSFGEDVQIGRQNHPTTWASTSPAFYLRQKLFDVGRDFSGADDYDTYTAPDAGPSTRLRRTEIGNDVWIGHGAMICAGVSIGHGAIVAANSVVARDVPAYAVVAGNPAVIKKFRVPPGLVSPLLNSRWWRFAPWQLAHLDLSDPAAFIRGLKSLKGAEPFQADVIKLKDWGPA